MTLFTGSSAWAEYRTIGKSKVTLNLYGGFTIPNNRLNGTGTLDGFTGMSFGMGIEYRMMPEVSMLFDLLYVQKGHLFLSGGQTSRYNVTYVELPIQIKWAPIPQLAFHAGPYLTAFIASAMKETGGVESSAIGEFKNDFGVTAGVWIGFQATQSLWLGVDFRYDIGLADIQQDADPTTNIYTRSFIGLATIGLYF